MHAGETALCRLDADHILAEVTLWRLVNEQISVVRFNLVFSCVKRAILRRDDTLGRGDEI